MSRLLMLLCAVSLAACTDGSDATDESDDTDTDTTGSAGPAVVAISAGEQHSVLLTEDGQIFVSGNNASGQACGGDVGLFENFTELELELPAERSITALASGSITNFMLLDDGSALACGWNGGGRLGINDESVERQFVPVLVDTTGIVAIRSGGGHTLVLDGDEELTGFGSNRSGEVGIGTSDSDVHIPTGLFSLEGENIVGFDAGGGHSAAVREDGAVYTWGNNLQGQLGGGPGPNAVNPQILTTVSDGVDVAVGGGHTLVLREDGTVWAFGFNTFGELGRGTESPVETPAAVTGLSNIVAIDTGSTFSMALDDRGRVFVWGDHGQGQLGQGFDFGPSSNTPVQVPDLPPITTIVAGSRHALAIDENGEVWGWGLMDLGQLGTGIGDWQSSPIQIF